MMRKWHDIFGSDSEDEGGFDALFFRSSNTTIYPDIDISELLNSDGKIFPIGRRTIGQCDNVQYISSHHCDVKYNGAGNVIITPFCKYDVVYIEDKLSPKGIPVAMKPGDKIRLCKNHFEYTLRAVTRKKKRRKPSADNSFSHEANSCETLSSRCSVGDVSLSRMQEEGVLMSLADVESAACARAYAHLETAKHISRQMLSSFYCDICLELIASCRSCVPCGHSFCGPCVQGCLKGG